MAQPKAGKIQPLRAFHKTRIELLLLIVNLSPIVPDGFPHSAQDKAAMARLFPARHSHLKHGMYVLVRYDHFVAHDTAQGRKDTALPALEVSISNTFLDLRRV